MSLCNVPDQNLCKFLPLISPHIICQCSGHVELVKPFEIYYFGLGFCDVGQIYNKRDLNSNENYREIKLTGHSKTKKKKRGNQVEI